MRIAILGKGRMGITLAKMLQREHEFIGYISEENYQELAVNVEAVFDFSNVAKLPLLVKFVELSHCKVIIGTTGYSSKDMKEIVALGEYISVCYSSNYSLGIHVLNRMLEVAMPYLLLDYDVELAEIHHRYKQDAPSGTTQLLIDTIKQFYPYKEVYGRAGVVGEREIEEIGVHSIRGGNVSGEHSVFFLGDNEELIITHKAFNHEIYAFGALRALDMLGHCDVGFYTFKSLLFEEIDE